MNITCDVIKDILPLYAENIVSDDTRILVEEHINSCESCKQELNKLNTPKEFSFDMDALPLKKVHSTLLKRKYFTILFTVSITILVIIIAMGYITAPEYIPYSNNPLTITESINNSVIVQVEDPGARYDIEKYSADDNSGYIYHISIWSSIWNRNMYQDPPADFVLNPKGEKVSSVYFSSYDGSEDVLIFGKDQNPNGGVIILPRLVLAYYLVSAVLCAVFLGFILWLFRKQKIMKDTIFKFFALPISYILGHICMKGFPTSSYSAKRDFYAILLAMIPIYCIILIANKWLRNRNKK